jgi:hypothetical protein
MVMDKRRLLHDTVQRLRDALGDRLLSVVLYGPGAHGDDYAAGDRNLMVVLTDLEPGTLERAADPIRRWLRARQPWPRLFTPATIAASADVFPIEFLDIARHHRVLVGEDPLASLEVRTAHLRLQCERELREKLMRLREGFVEAVGRERALRELLAASYPSFAFVFRGCLHLVGERAPIRDRDVVAATCRRLGLAPAPFEAVEAIASGLRGAGSSVALYSDYVTQLAEAVARVDALAAESQGDTP